mgnify:CR=1 FL=1
MKHSVSDSSLYYIECLASKDYLQTFSSEENIHHLHSISEEQSAYRYAPDKWSIKQIIGHIIDHERIMTYRTLRFSRKDVTLLPSYDQNLLVENSRFDEQSFSQLLTDFENVRSATISFIKSLSQEQLALTVKPGYFKLQLKIF